MFHKKQANNATPEQKSELLKVAQKHCTATVVSADDLPLASKFKLRTASADHRAEIRLLTQWDDGPSDSETAAEIVVKDTSDEQRAVELAKRGLRYLIVSCPNWKVIPLENLIARTRNKTSLLADVSSLSDAKVALQTLELGVDGVVITTRNPSDIEEIGRFVKQMHEAITLTSAKIVSIKALGSGVRVCVDTCEIMEPGAGMLVGSQSSGVFLVEAEVPTNPHVEPRPFRVNAGPVSSYILTPGSKTRYLSELQAGDEVLIVNRLGGVRVGHIARVKIERRPFTLIQTQAEGRQYSIIVQNAETVRLVSKNTSKSVSDLKLGDEVLLRIEQGGRHFGTLVAEEMVIER